MGVRHALGFFLTWPRDGMFFWLYPILATAGSVTGAAVTYWIGHKIGEVGLERFVPASRLERFRTRVQKQ